MAQPHRTADTHPAPGRRVRGALASLAAMLVLVGCGTTSPGADAPDSAESPPEAAPRVAQACERATRLVENDDSPTWDRQVQRYERLREAQLSGAMSAYCTETWDKLERAFKQHRTNEAHKKNQGTDDPDQVVDLADIPDERGDTYQGVPIPADLAGRGIDEGLMRNVGVVGLDLGYLWEGVGPEDVFFFATALIISCDRVADGETTWDEEAVMSGAPPGVAAEMNAYLRDDFCLQLN